MTDHSILCGDCGSAAQVVREDDGAEHVRCAGCGKTATRDEAVMEAGNYARSMVAKNLSASMKRIASKSKILTYKAGTPQKAKFAWIIDGV